MKKTLFKIWYVVIGLGSVYAYINRDYVLEGGATSDFSNWLSSIVNKQERATIRSTECKNVFILETKQGEILVPERMLKTFKEDGIQVSVAYDVMLETDTLCSLGKQVAITKMKRLY